MKEDHIIEDIFNGQILGTNYCEGKDCGTIYDSSFPMFWSVDIPGTEYEKR
jgi:hypothetical protein